ncbi:hypothetical protein HU200_040354 [Digitaria exilis]|uniref:Uncharacterized protein n=1 Tax=Digitaria exilis TaxID=1010633 RepID=A0A835B8K3_9POAL|nr:hypothetical protein HU200_040354 [Digitaria exilis]CAB3449036.1 unnamed protein product [Digitaria exilis]
MGLELEFDLLPTQLPPIRTASLDVRGGGDDNAVADGCSTPTMAASVLPPPLVCPPAPRKKPRPPPPAMAKIKKLQRRCGSAGLRPAHVRWFVAVPEDVLAAVFVARPAAAPATNSPPCPTSSSSPETSKKIRVHVVG